MGDSEQVNKRDNYKAFRPIHTMVDQKTYRSFIARCKREGREPASVARELFQKYGKGQV